MSISLLRLLIERLERVEADSVWAHRASGLRRALLSCMEQAAAGNPPDDARLRLLIRAAFAILEQAAREKRL